MTSGGRTDISARRGGSDRREGGEGGRDDCYTYSNRYVQ